MNALRLILAAAAGVIASHAYEGGGLARWMPGAGWQFTAPQASSLFSAAAARPYANCAEARAAGAAPVRRGDPGYAPWLDRDHDGIGCEKWP